MRLLAVEMSNWRDDDESSASSAADQARITVTDCCKMMRRLLELDPHGLHCTLIVMRSGPDGNAGDFFSDWVHSEPIDDRTPREGPENVIPVSRETPLAALLARSDTRLKWREYNCFACNDLTRHIDTFACSRPDWSSYFKSIMVLPIRCVLAGRQKKTIAFLAFDSPYAGAFRGLPNIYEFIGRPAEYHDRLQNVAAFHLGAIFVDTLGTILGPIYEQFST